MTLLNFSAQALLALCFLIGAPEAVSADSQAAVYPLLVEGMYGLVDGQGQLVLPPELEDIREFTTEKWVPAKKGGLWGFIDRTGQFVVPPGYLEVGMYSENGLAPAQNADPNYPSPERSRNFSALRWGYIDRNGKWRLPPRFEQAEPFASNGLAAAKQGDRWGYIDGHGRWIIVARFFRARNFQKNGLAAATEESGKWGLIDRRGAWVTPPRYQALHHDDRLGGFSPFHDTNGWGFLAADGKVAIAARFQAVKAFRQDRWAAAKLDGKWGYIDRRGEFAIPPRFSDASGFVTDRAAVKTAGKYGYIDRSGEFVIPAGYVDAEPFSSDGRAPVKAEERWGIIDRQGNWVVSPRFGSLVKRSFAPGRLTAVQDQGFATWMDAAGRTLSLRHHCGTTVVRDFDDKLIWPPDLDRQCIRDKAGEHPQAAAMADYMSDQLAWKAVRKPGRFVPLADLRKQFEELKSPHARKELAPQMDKITKGHRYILDWLHKTRRMTQAQSPEGLTIDFSTTGENNISVENAEIITIGIDVLNGHQCTTQRCRLHLQVSSNAQGNAVLQMLEIKS